MHGAPSCIQPNPSAHHNPPQCDPELHAYLAALQEPALEVPYFALRQADALHDAASEAVGRGTVGGGNGQPTFTRKHDAGACPRAGPVPLARTVGAVTH